jgi:hypothetical protein
MKFNVKSIIKYSDKEYKYDFQIEYLNKEEIVFISLNELKYKLLNEIKLKDGNLSIVPKNVKLSILDNLINISADAKTIEDWKMDDEYDFCDI